MWKDYDKFEKNDNLRKNFKKIYEENAKTSEIYFEMFSELNKIEDLMDSDHTDHPAYERSNILQQKLQQNESLSINYFILNFVGIFT